jgi:hypothetical protein
MIIVPTMKELVSFLDKFIIKKGSYHTGGGEVDQLQPTGPAPPQMAKIYQLLRLATITAPTKPLKNHEVFVLSDICRSFQELAALIVSDRGRAYLGEYLDEGTVDAIFGFWHPDSVMEKAQ